MMDEVLQRLNEISKKAEKLELFVHKIKQERDQLRAHLAEAKARLEAENRNSQELEEKYEAAKLVKGLANGEDKEAIRMKIDSYLEEIDFCLKIFGDQE